MANMTVPHEFSKVFDILGKRWTGLIVVALSSGPLHFIELTRGIPDIFPSILSARLKELVAEGIVSRNVVEEMPIRINYQLTEKGAALQPILQQMYNWANTWIQ